MQVLISSSLPSLDFIINWASAKNGRAMEIKSKSLPSTFSAVAGLLMRLVATNGTVKSPPAALRKAAVGKAKAPRGTAVAIVGTRASCYIGTYNDNDGRETPTAHSTILNRGESYQVT